MKAKTTGRILALMLVVVFVAAGVLTATPNAGNSTPTVTATVNPNNSPVPPTVVFPTVPPSGTAVISDYTYFHSSGLISLPHLVGFELSTPNGEETLTPSGTNKITRVSSTFIDGSALAVVHAFAELNPDRNTPTVQDFDKYYDKKNLDDAWSNFKGGYKELDRRVDGNQFIINFELYLDNHTYLGRQISSLNQNWLMVTRLVVPNNNPKLMDDLQNVIVPGYHLWVAALNAPLNWGSIADYVSGYVIKYPPDWKTLSGKAGQPYIVSGAVGANIFTLTTQVAPNKSLQTEDDVRAWMKATWPTATVQLVKPATNGDITGFAVAYAKPDSDGNQNSAIVTLFNSPNKTLYVANIESTIRGINFLDSANSAVPVELTQIRNSFFLIPSAQLVLTLTPTITPTLVPTIVATSAATAAK